MHNFYIDLKTIYFKTDSFLANLLFKIHIILKYINLQLSIKYLTRLSFSEKSPKRNRATSGDCKNQPKKIVTGVNFDDESFLLENQMNAGQPLMHKTGLYFIIIRVSPTSTKNGLTKCQRTLLWQCIQLRKISEISGIQHVIFCNGNLPLFNAFQRKRGGNNLVYF